MSVGQLTQNNSYKLYLSTAETGININGTRLNSNGTDYELILPNDNDIGPLSVLLVDSIDGNKVFLKWSFPIDPPQAPFNYIECNTLKANVEVISRSLTIDNISGGSSNFTYDGLGDLTYKLPDTLPNFGTNGLLQSNSDGDLEWTNEIDEITVGQLNATENINTPELQIRTPIQNGSIKFKLQTANQTEYILPNSQPTTTNDVLRCNLQGEMFWDLPPINTTRNFVKFDNFPQDVIYPQGVDTLLDDENVILLSNKRYKATFTLIGGAGGLTARRFRVFIVAIDTVSFQPVNYLYEPPYLSYDSSNEIMPTLFNFIFTTPASLDELRTFRVIFQVNCLDNITARGWYYDIQPF